MDQSLEQCGSDDSNISVTSQEYPTKMKEKEEEDEYGTKDNTTSRVLLDLKLANSSNELTSKENPNPDSKLEPNLLQSNEEGNLLRSTSESKTFTCNFCRREFSTSQALGGHQNAHKQERALAKHRHNMVDITVAGEGSVPQHGHSGYSYYPYSPYPHQPPFHGSFNRSSLGVRAESIIQKPYLYYQPWSSSSPFSSHYGREKMHRAYLISPSQPLTPSYDGLSVENFQTRGLGIESLGPSLSLGGNPNPVINNNNIATTTRVIESDGDHHQQLRFGIMVDDVDDPSGLDLDLKL